jgi:hypothetical protein
MRHKSSANVLSMLSVSLLLGCISQIPRTSDFAQSWIGAAIDEYYLPQNRPGSYARQIGWPETIYQLPNGNAVHVAAAKPNCFIHFEVNHDRKIVGYKTEGARCD